jgi:hypothetical protein
MHSNRIQFDAFGVIIIPWYVSVGGRAVHPFLFSFVLELTHRLDNRNGKYHSGWVGGPLFSLTCARCSHSWLLTFL